MQTPLADYAQGAALATALTNSRPTSRSSGELLTGPSALGRFLTEHLAPPAPTAYTTQPPAHLPTVHDLAQVRALRQELYRLIAADDEESLVTGATALLGRAARPTLRRDPTGRWQWHVVTPPEATLAEQLGVVAACGLLGTLRALGHDRFRRCASPGCTGVFVDTSKAGRRRYCMPSLCGNRLNVANHRARRVTESSR